jgi:hypothetical protein
MNIINCNHENSVSSDSDDNSYLSVVEKEWTKLESMTEDDMRKNSDEIDDWFYVSANKKLSEDFIREFRSKVVWDCISSHQKLSEKYRHIKNYLRNLLESFKMYSIGMIYRDIKNYLKNVSGNLKTNLIYSLYYAIKNYHENLYKN